MVVLFQHLLNLVLCLLDKAQEDLMEHLEVFRLDTLLIHLKHLWIQTGHEEVGKITSSIASVGHLPVNDHDTGSAIIFIPEHQVVEVEISMLETVDALSMVSTYPPLRHHPELLM